MALIALGVSGGIGAYKAVEVARGLQADGHDVAAIMTVAATRFVGPLTFEAITRRRVVTDQFEPGINASIEHIRLASEIAALVVAPATANVVGKLANGIADDFLSALYLATTAPVLLAPAMNTNMLAHAAVRRNLDTLASRGVRFVEPGEGYLACGWVGKGRLAEPAEIVTAVRRMLEPGGRLAGRCLVVTAGPTYEDLDPVRYLGNRSTGRMGFAVAAEAMARGARVVLIAGPTNLDPPAGAEIRRVRSAVEMQAAVTTVASEADAVVMAAAVSDYAPADGPATEKIRKTTGHVDLALQRTPDILAELGRQRGEAGRPVLIGFCAETSNLVDRARAKLVSKQIDVIVGNNVSQPGAGFEVDTNAAVILSRRDDAVDSVPLGSKRTLAGVILDHLERQLAPSAPVASGPRNA